MDVANYYQKNAFKSNDIPIKPNIYEDINKYFLHFKNVKFQVQVKEIEKFKDILHGSVVML